MSTPERRPHPLGLFFAAWLVPGLGHWLLAKRAKAMAFFALIVGTFVMGMALAGFQNVYYVSGRWTALTQAPAGLVAYAGTWLKQGGTDAVAEEGAYFKVGTLYTSVAGLLNLVVLMDAVHLGCMRRRGGKR